MLWGCQSPIAILGACLGTSCAQVHILLEKKAHVGSWWLLGSGSVPALGCSWVALYTRQPGDCWVPHSLRADCLFFYLVKQIIHFSNQKNRRWECSSIKKICLSLLYCVRWFFSPKQIHYHIQTVQFDKLPSLPTGDASWTPRVLWNALLHHTLLCCHVLPTLVRFLHEKWTSLHLKAISRHSWAQR